MKILKQIYFIIFIIFSIFFSNFIASKINISLEFNSIVGEYSKNDYHPINDFLKFIVYIFLPLIAFITAKFYLDNKVFDNFFSNLNLKTKIYSFDVYIYIYFLTIIFLIIIELLSVQFPLNTIDFFHEGQKLSAAYKSKIDSSLWSGSYVVVGIIFDSIITKQNQSPSCPPLLLFEYRFFNFLNNSFSFPSYFFSRLFILYVVAFSGLCRS